MKAHEIAIFSVSRIISERISTLLVEKNIDLPIYELEHYDVIDKAKELVNAGTKVIISRGGTAAVLRRCVDVPVIEIAHDFYGTYKTIEEAKLLGKKIVAIGFPQYCNMLNHFQSITKDNFKICQVYNHKDIENIMSEVKDEGYDVVVGGLTVSHYAKKFGLHVVMGDTDNLSIEVALNQAFNILDHIKDKNYSYTVIDSTLNFSSDGMISFDGEGFILKINQKAKRAVGCNVGDNIFRFDVFSQLHDFIIDENNVNSLIIESNGHYFNASLKHINSKEKFFSIIRLVEVTSAKHQLSIGKDNSYPAKYHFSDIIGESPELRECIFDANKYAKSDFPVYIEGETGTGKELFAQSIHNASHRAKRPFIALNCSAIPETLLESELFGYEEGVFTGAKKGGKAGIFELVQGGTLFLDEISEVTPLVQLKLLRVLQEHAFSRIGGNALISTDFRLITASNKSLKQLVQDNLYREDFYYRINILKLAVPNLVSRGSDVLLLANDLLEKNDKTLHFTEGAQEFLSQYSWPGNIRELQSLIYRLIVLNDGGVVDVDSLVNFGEFNACEGDSVVGQCALEKNEVELIKKALIETKGDRGEAARILGISSTTLWRRIKKYNLE